MNTERFDFLTTPIEPGQALIEASAGTGKTFAITGLVLRLVLEGRAPDLRRLLVVTFTVAATDELKTRIRTALREALWLFSGLGPVDTNLRPLLEAFRERYGASPDDVERSVERLGEALQQVDEAGIFTIHGFCKRVLEQAAFESGTAFTMNFMEEADTLLQRSATDFWHRHGYSNTLLAALVIDQGWGGMGLINHYYQALRYPDTCILPTTDAVDETLRRLEEQVALLAATWNEGEVLSLLDSLRWNKDAPLAPSTRDKHFTGVMAVTQGILSGNLDSVAACTPASIEDKAYKRSKAAKEQLEQVLAHPAFAACNAVTEAVEEVRLAVVQAFIREVAPLYDRLKRNQNVLTFDDLLRHLYDALRDEQGGPALVHSIQEQYDLALIDEFQDTDPFQYDIFRRAFAGRPVFLIGDPKQAIYAFRGADIFAYLEAQRSAARRYSLGKNWRSAAGLVQAVNAVFEDHPRPFVYADILFERVEAAGFADRTPLHGDDKPPLVWWYSPPRETSKGYALAYKGQTRTLIVGAIVQEIQRLLGGSMQLGSRALEPGDIAVLVRKNRQAEELQTALRAVGITAVIAKTGDIMASQEMGDLEYILQAVAQPRNPQALCAALATELWGYTAEEIHHTREDEQAWTALVEELRSWHRQWRQQGFLHMIYRFMETVQVHERMLSYTNGERRLTNLRHVVEVLHNAEQKGNRSMEELLHWLRTRENTQLAEREEAELRLESDALAIQIATIHNSKGLEYEIVFCPYLWDYRAPQPEERPLVHTNYGVVYDLGSDELSHHNALAEAEHLAEDLRLAYVALTRAKHRCYVAWGPVSGGESSAIGYLLHGQGVTDAPTTKDYVEQARVQAGAGLMDAFEVLQALATRCEYMTVEPLSSLFDTGYNPTATNPEEETTLRPRKLSEAAAQRLEPWGITSFSTWRSGAVEGRIPGMVFERDSGLPEEEIFGFAAGLQAGQCLHDILQHTDFMALEEERVRPMVRRTLQKHALADPSRHRSAIMPEDVVLAMLQRVAEVTLPERDIKLSEVSRKHRLEEWRFVLPMGLVSPSDLADAFEAHAKEPLRSTYTPLLRQLESQALEGFLTGIADLVFEHEGRWYLIDWKSNHLGNSSELYSPDALRHAMFAHHYVLQYHLYVLALHRYLQTRISDYHYDQHFGGGWYVFLRGLVPGETSGLYYDRPPWALIQALDECIVSTTPAPQP